MELSVVVPTFNSRERLSTCLDALAQHTTSVETIVVNGPSTDGTTGMIHERDDVDVLIELATRNINTARNVGLAEATADVIGLVAPEYAVGGTWESALESALESGADVVTGPTFPGSTTDTTTTRSSVRTIAGRTVVPVAGGNLALTRRAVTALDGFDEYLEVGGARDLAHRLAGLDLAVVRDLQMGVRGGLQADGGEHEIAHRRHLAEPDGSQARHWFLEYRCLTYRLVKNYGVRPYVVRRTIGAATSDALATARDVVRGSVGASSWIGNGTDVVQSIALGTKDGLVARRADRSPTRNPHGISNTSPKRIVECYDWR